MVTQLIYHNVKNTKWTSILTRKSTIHGFTYMHSDSHRGRSRPTLLPQIDFYCCQMRMPLSAVVQGQNDYFPLEFLAHLIRRMQMCYCCQKLEIFSQIRSRIRSLSAPFCHWL